MPGVCYFKKYPSSCPKHERDVQESVLVQTQVHEVKVKGWERVAMCSVLRSAVLYLKGCLGQVYFKES